MENTFTKIPFLEISDLFTRKVPEQLSDEEVMKNLEHLASDIGVEITWDKPLSRVIYEITYKIVNGVWKHCAKTTDRINYLLGAVYIEFSIRMILNFLLRHNPDEAKQMENYKKLIKLMVEIIQRGYWRYMRLPGELFSELELAENSFNEPLLSMARGDLKFFYGDLAMANDLYSKVWKSDCYTLDLPRSLQHYFITSVYMNDLDRAEEIIEFFVRRMKDTDNEIENVLKRQSSQNDEFFEDLFPLDILHNFLYGILVYMKDINESHKKNVLRKGVPVVLRYVNRYCNEQQKRDSHSLIEELVLSAAL